MFNLANILTAGNLFSGILAILLAVSGRLDIAPYAIFLGLIFDFLDGFVARLLKTSGELGKQLDSLADMVTFGVAPGIMMMMVMVSLLNDESLFFSNGNYFAYWVRGVVHFRDVNYLPLVAFLIPFFSLFRLAKFNIDTRQSESFIGLPTPAMTLFFMMFPLVLGVRQAEEGWNAFQAFLLEPYVIAALVLMLSVLMVTNLPLFSLKFKHFKFKGNEIRYVFLLISLGLIVFLKVWSIAIIVFLYLILSLVENTFKKNRHEV